MRKKTYVAVLGRWSEAGAITPLLIFGRKAGDLQWIKCWTADPWLPQEPGDTVCGIPAASADS